MQVSLACPNVESLKVTDNVMATGPLTQEQLVRAIERRATVVVDNASRRCVYVPQFTLAQGDLQLKGVNTDCH